MIGVLNGKEAVRVQSWARSTQAGAVSGVKARRQSELWRLEEQAEGVDRLDCHVTWEQESEISLGHGQVGHFMPVKESPLIREMGRHQQVLSKK